MSSHYFYGKPIPRHSEQERIQRLLAKYKGEEVTEELKRKVWEELQREKHRGTLTIPFKLAIRRDAYNLYPPFLEVILDTKL